MKNKTIKLISILVITLILASQAVFAASEKPYTVELKNGFTEEADGVYASDENGVVFIIETDPSEEEKNEEYFYSNKSLEDGLKDLNDGTAKEMAKDILKGMFADEYSEEEIEQMVDLIKIEVKKKEISTFTKNNYKCLHYVINFSIEDETYLVMDIYGTLKNEKIYMLVSYTEPEKNDGAKNLINSFTFVEKEEPKTEETKSEEVKEEPKSEEVKEEPKTEEPKSEVKEETKKDEAKSEVKEDTKKEETKDTTVKEGKLPQTGVAVSFEAIALSILSLGTALFAINNKRK